MSRKLLEITSITSLFTKNEELTSQLKVGQNTLKVLQEAFNTKSSKLVELGRQHHKLEQYFRRECLDFSGMLSSVAPKDLENFVQRLLQEIDVDLDKSQIVACHRLGKKDRTIVKFLNRNNIENGYSNQRRLKDINIFCLLYDGILERNNVITGGQNDWMERGLYRKRIYTRTTCIFMVQSKRRKQRVLFLIFWSSMELSV